MADVTVKGVELEATALGTDNLVIKANVSYNDGKYRKFTTDSNGGGVDDVDLSSLPLTRTSKVKWAINGLYTKEVLGGTMAHNVVVSHADKSIFYYCDISPACNSYPDEKNLLDASITYTAPENKWFVRGFGNNLTDERFRIASQVVGKLWTHSRFGPRGNRCIVQPPKGSCPGDVMAVAVDARPRPSWFRPKYFVFGCIALMMLYVLLHNERFLIDRSNPEWEHIRSFQWWLLAHGLAGACALSLAPLQFSDRLRQRYRKVHRVIGRIYITGAFVLAPLGAYIQYIEEPMGQPRSFTMAAVADAVLLFSTTAIAFYFILNRRIQQHRQWMTRSYAVALVFFEVRLISGVFGFDDSLAAGETIVWLCIVFAIPLADVVLQIQESRRARAPTLT